MEHPLLVNFLVIFFFSLVILFLSLPRDNSKKEDGHGSCSKSSKVLLASKVYSAPRVFHVPRRIAEGRHQRVSGIRERKCALSRRRMANISSAKDLRGFRAELGHDAA